jgi:hypothetical protein
MNAFEPTDWDFENLGSRVRELGNRLICAWRLIDFHVKICQGLAAAAVRSNLYKCSHGNYDLASTNKR